MRGADYGACQDKQDWMPSRTSHHAISRGIEESSIFRSNDDWEDLGKKRTSSAREI